MTENPDLPQLARIPAQEVVTWLLQRPALTLVFKETAAAASAAMATSAQDVVGIDLSKVLTNVGSQVVGVVSAVSPDSGANALAALESAQQAAEESGPLAIYQEG
jgi:hypothetical protein